MRKSNRVDLERQIIKEKKMGRPLKKDVRGTDVLGLSGTAGISNTNTGITVSGYFGGALSTAYSIIKQRGANSFVVAKKETFTADTTNGSPLLTSMSDQVEVTVGDEITGVGIPAGARVASIDSATQVTMTVAATADGTTVTFTHHGAYQVGKLVDTTPNANGEILLQGSPVVGTSGGESAGTSAGLVPIAKITRRLAYGFPSSPVLSGGFNRGEDNNTSTNHDATRYTWYLESDSSADYIVLTAI
jgi:hypothetical protein